MTPLMKQYLAVKAARSDCLIFFRLGDFYELFFDDAVTAAKLLQLTLTSRDKNEDNPIPMCGVPHHAAKGYVEKLVNAGYKVAICEQMEEPGPGKSLVRREVTQVVAPGTVLDGDALLPSKPNYIALVARKGELWCLAHADITLGRLWLSSWADREALEAAVLRLEPRHLLTDCAGEDSELSQSLIEALPALFSESFQTTWRGAFPLSTGPLAAEQFSVEEREAAHALLSYLHIHMPAAIPALSPFSRFSETALMPLDAATQKHLELFKTADGEAKGSLFSYLNIAETPMGARLLREWLAYPSLDLAEIRARQQAVSTLKLEGMTRTALREALHSVYDLDRLQSKVAAGRAGPRDLIALGRSLEGLERLIALLQDDLVGAGRLKEVKAGLLFPPEILAAIRKTLADEVPLAVRDGSAIRNGVSEELDRLRSLSRDGKGALASLERREREETGISSLKIRYNRVFGYYIEVTNTHKAKVPERYFRKQTTVNAERYITDELKHLEDDILSAERRMLDLEEALFAELCTFVSTHTEPVRRAARAAAELDVLLVFAELAERGGWICPEIDTGFSASFKDLVHPILAKTLSKGQFVGNDVAFCPDTARLLLITGPNMAGKSTVMRSVAVAFILAQMGAFVPATAARLGVADRIFTRIGASDRLREGQSTFMVEMVETAAILKEATDKSLILLDEIGRGTSTFDGLSLARAVVEHIVKHVGARTLFATHYHELSDLEAAYPVVRNFTMAIKEWEGALIFLYRFIRGCANRSYGIEVAKLAGLPESVIGRAKEILSALEVGERVSEERLEGRPEKGDALGEQLDLFSAREQDVLGALRSANPNAMTPIEALALLDRLKRELLGPEKGGL